MGWHGSGGLISVAFNVEAHSLQSTLSSSGVVRGLFIFLYLGGQ